MDNNTTFIGLLSSFDMIIAAIIILLSIKGFIRGFFKEIFGLIGLIVGAYVAARVSKPVAHFIDTNLFHLDNFSLLTLIAFLSVFVLIWLASAIIGGLFSRMTDPIGLGFFNRLFGFIAGGAKYFLIFAVIVTALSNVSIMRDKLQKITEDSILYPHLKKAGSFLINLDMKKLGLDTIGTSTPKPVTKPMIVTKPIAKPVTRTVAKPVTRAVRTNNTVKKVNNVSPTHSTTTSNVTSRSTISH